MRILSLALRFLLELALLVALGVWGFTVPENSVVAVVLGVGAPLTAAVLWGLFVAPKAPRRLEDPARFSLELMLWISGGLALLAAGHPGWALAFGVLVVVSLGMMTILGQRRTA